MFKARNNLGYCEQSSTRKDGLKHPSLLDPPLIRTFSCWITSPVDHPFLLFQGDKDSLSYNTVIAPKMRDVGRMIYERGECTTLLNSQKKQQHHNSRRERIEEAPPLPWNTHTFLTTVFHSFHGRFQVKTKRNRILGNQNWENGDWWEFNGCVVKIMSGDQSRSPLRCLGR